MGWRSWVNGARGKKLNRNFGLMFLGRQAVGGCLVAMGAVSAATFIFISIWRSVKRTIFLCQSGAFPKFVRNLFSSSQQLFTHLVKITYTKTAVLYFKQGQGKARQGKAVKKTDGRTDNSVRGEISGGEGVLVDSDGWDGLQGKVEVLTIFFSIL